MTTQLRPVQLTLLLLFITAISLQAQWTTTGTNITSLGKVGIGIASTVTPANELHIRANNGSSNADLILESSNLRQWSLVGRDNSFGVMNSSNSIDYMTVLTSGSIGMGTPSPAAALHVASISNSTLLKLQNTYGGVGQTAQIDFVTYNNSNSVNARIGAVDVGSNNGALAFYTDGDNIDNSNVQERMRITQAGNVGIGTTAPSSYLDIADNNASPGTRFLEIGNDAYLTDVDVPNILGIYGQTDNTSGGIELGSSGPTLFGSSAGYLGIGTTLPGALLHVAGGDLRVDGRIAIGGNMNTLAGVALSVNGSIYSKATYVTVNGWPDDVFDSKYQLKGLDEVEDYIKKHKHLPSIPSEKEITEKGLDTGEMLKLQMAKIEEITLYMIELKKENKAMKEENKEMKKAIEALKK